jgi:hypothetical protein
MSWWGGSSADRVLELRALLARLANEETPLHATESPVTGDWDLHDRSRPADLRKADYLAVLRAAHMVLTTVGTIVQDYTDEALRVGADFSEIGATAGISRQAARQRHRRHRAPRTVRLVGGPRDGSEHRIIGLAREIRRSESPGRWEEEDTVDSVYRVKFGSPEVFEFQHYEDSEGRTFIEWDRRPRLYQLASFWDVESATVLAEARALSARVRSASSRVELADVELLRQALGARFNTRLSSPFRHEHDDE